MIRILKFGLRDNLFGGHNLLLFTDETVFLKFPTPGPTYRLGEMIPSIIQVKIFSQSLIFDLEKLDKDGNVDLS